MKPARANMERRLPGVAVILAAGILVLLASCKGLPTKGELAEREHFAQFQSRFRPGENPPALPDIVTSPTLNNFLGYAVLRQPRVEAAYYEWAATIERITIERSFPDPVFTVGVDVQKGLEQDVANMVMALMGGVMVELPGPGKLRARADLATEESKAAFARFEQAAIEAALSARQVYYDFYLLGERHSITRKNLGLLGDIEASAKGRVEAGLGSIGDLLQIENTIAQLQTDLANIEDERTALLAAWKSSLGVPSEESAPPAPSIFEFTDPARMSEARLDEALANNPVLRVMAADIKRAEAALAVAYKSRVPDFSFGLETESPLTPGARTPRESARDTLWQPRLGVTVPIWKDRIAAEIAEAEAMKLAAESDYSAEQLEIAREFAMTSFGIREITRNLDVLSAKLVPKQEEVVSITQLAYQEGAVTFFELVEQQRRLLEFELMQAEGRTGREKLLGELLLAVLGRPPVTALNTGGDAAP
ncbi:TolC family protein [Candidatus Poribacteria bacterium]|nr:TolC family protein [Candidatus Poribacteria bacterium]